MKKKRVMLVAPPFSGHLHPMLGIAKRVQEVAEVLVVSTSSGVATAEACGLSAREILSGEEDKVWAITEPGTSVKGNPLLLYRQLKANVALMGRMKRDLSAVIAETGPDVVIADFTVPVAGLAALEQGKRWWTVLPSPCVLETVDGPPAYFGGQMPAQGMVQRVMQWGMRRATRVFKRAMFLLFRRQFTELGFSAIYRDDGSEAVYSPEHVFGLGIQEVEFPRSYGAAFQLVGPVLFTPHVQAVSPDHGSGPRKQVLVTLGTHLQHVKQALAAEVKRMAGRYPEVMFHFSHGKKGALLGEQGENYREYEFVSYADHLDRYDSIVHHAGSGVMYHSLRCGKPAVVYPVDYDQFDNAARLVWAGAGESIRAMNEIEPAVMRVLSDETMARRCCELAEAVKRYDAAGRIASLLSD